MADDSTEEQTGTGRALKRRGLIAGAAALVAGMAAKGAAQPVAADGALQAPGANTASGVTTLQYTSGTNVSNANILTVSDGTDFTSSHTAAVAGYAEAGRVNAGVFGYGHYGVVGKAPGGDTGVIGEAGAGGNGVFGVSNGSLASYGIYGRSDVGLGAVGNSSSGDGVYGSSSSSGVCDGNGVYGFVGHVGATRVTAGVFGDSDHSYGIVGRTTAVNYSGCTGVADGAGRAAFAGAGTGGAYGAYFTGPTVVQGNFTVVNGAKNAAVKHTDGSYRLLHCVESPEAWFEDFGEAKLVNGKAEVKLDPDFAAVVDASSYMVFLTERDAHNDLYVTKQTAGGFAVQAKAGTPSGGFYYRIVAKRKDINPGRMAKFELPKIRLPKPEEMPPPVPLKKP